MWSTFVLPMLLLLVAHFPSAYDVDLASLRLCDAAAMQVVDVGGAQVAVFGLYGSDGGDGFVKVFEADDELAYA